ncbi:MAG TPA: hypothetical protein VD913_04485 [bacterium]|nr:hypothetical protein [bacterium]
MELSVLVAKILALVYVAAGISALRGKPTFREMIENFERSPALTYVSGFMTLVLGALLVAYHNIWVRNWTVLITIVGWLSLVKGVMLIAFPGYISFFKNWYQNTWVWGIFMIVIGLVFGYFGFIL